MQLKPQVISRLGDTGENMLQGMCLPELNFVWLEAVLIEKICLLQLVPSQQSTLETGICGDQFSNLMEYTH